MDPNKNYYKTLGIEKNASESEIKKAYRKKAIETHPDKNNGNDSDFKSANEAYKILSNKNTKNRYDSQSPHGKNYTGGNFSNFGSFSFNHDPFSIFEQFFGKGFSNFRQREDFKEELDILINLNVDLKKIYENKPIKISYNRNIRCEDCNGTGFDRNSEPFICEVCDGKGVDVYGFKCRSCLGEGKIYSDTCKTCNGEKVINKKQEITLEKVHTIRKSTRNINRGFGHQSKYYREKVGSLIVNINFVNDKNYRIENYDLHYIKNVHFKDAIDGKEIIHENVDNSKIKIKLPEKTKDKDIIRLKNRGLLINNNERGNLYLKINIIIDYDLI